MTILTLMNLAFISVTVIFKAACMTYDISAWKKETKKKGKALGDIIIIIYSLRRKGKSPHRAFGKLSLVADVVWMDG